MKCYTLGYSGRKPLEILGLLESLDAMVADIRYSPNSRVPHWRKVEMERLFGDRYLHLQSLGNPNYRSDSPIALADPEAGILAIKALSKPAVLLCACRDYEACHRATVADILRTEGMTVKELSSTSLSVWQPSLLTGD